MDKKDLIEEYKANSKKLVIARAVTSLGILGVILLFVSLIVCNTSAFFKHESANLGTVLQKKITPIASHYMKDLAPMASRLVPVYHKAFEDRINKDADKIEGSFNKELSLLNSYTNDKWKNIEALLSKEILKQEEVALTELKSILGDEVTEEDIARIASNYKQAGEDYAAKLIEETLSDHIKVADEIKLTSSKISEKYSNEDKLNPHEIIGIILEMAGFELQKLQ